MRHLVCGIGSIGTRHMNNIGRLFPDHQIETVDPDPLKSATYQSYVPHSTYKDALVYICTPTPTHLIDFACAQQSGARAVFIEKPLAEAGIVIEPKPSIPVAVGYQYRYNSIIMALHKNPPEELHVCAMDNLIDRYGPTALTTMASHAIDYALWINGPADKWMVSDEGRKCDISIMHTNGHESVIYCKMDNAEGRVLNIQVGRRRHVDDSHDYEIIDIPPDDSMYERELLAWMHYVETRESGDLCLWDDAMKVQEIMNGSKV